MLNGKGAASCLELPSSFRRELEVEEIGQEEVETAMHKMKKARLEMLEMAGEVGVKWTGRLLNVCAGGKDTERVEDGPVSADMEEERGCA